MDNHSSQYEVVIVGGSYAGLSAALALGRSLRKVLIIDDGKPCNRQTPHSHNFLTWDGATPAEIGQAAREQVEKYPTVSWLHERVADIDGADGNFKVITQSGQEFSSKKIIFTTGVRDIIPPIPGMAESWGSAWCIAPTATVTSSATSLRACSQMVPSPYSSAAWSATSPTN